MFNLYCIQDQPIFKTGSRNIINHRSFLQLRETVNTSHTTKIMHLRGSYDTVWASNDQPTGTILIHSHQHITLSKKDNI